MNIHIVKEAHIPERTFLGRLFNYGPTQLHYIRDRFQLGSIRRRSQQSTHVDEIDEYTNEYRGNIEYIVAYWIWVGRI